MLPLSVFSINLVSSHLLLLLPLLVFVAVPLTKVGSRLGAPVLLLFLLLGMACGADGLGIYYEDYHQAEAIGHFAMMIILFSSGLETSFRKTKPRLRILRAVCQCLRCLVRSVPRFPRCRILWPDGTM